MPKYKRENEREREKEGMYKCINIEPDTYLERKQGEKKKT